MLNKPAQTEESLKPRIFIVAIVVGVLNIFALWWFTTGLNH